MVWAYNPIKLSPNIKDVQLKTIFPAIACALILGSCAIAPLLSSHTAPLPAVRFLLTFDDGPSPAMEDNPTAKIADTLATNAVQAGIKAVFFVQTRWPGAGGSPVGQILLHRLVAEGHVLGLHSGTARGHIDHTLMSETELATSLADGSGDIKAIQGKAPDLVRPPNWQFNDITLAAYKRASLGMLLTDTFDRDGGPEIFQVRPNTPTRILRDLVRFRERLEAKEISPVNGVVPLVMTFHDPNGFTAEHLTEYLTILPQVAREAGLKIAKRPFYTQRAELWRAARTRVGTTFGPG